MMLYLWDVLILLPVHIVPSIGHYDASVFFADASLSYLTKSSENRIDLFLLTAGFRFDSNKLSGALSGIFLVIIVIAFNQKLRQISQQS
jgi:4-amino-4-deoxy-L-arabinose transferase-like glycosyltransferase